MGIEIRLPQITGTTEREQLAQVKSYLYQLAEQLQWGLKNIDTSNNTVIIKETPKSLYPSSITPKDAQATFAAIKGLIIKSADIVEAYYEEINKKLTGLYVASSDFGTIKQATEQDIEANSTGISQAFSNIQGIETSLSDEVGQIASDLQTAKTDIDSDLQGIKDDIITLNYSIVEANAHIKSGVIDEVNGLPVYGLEIGQKNVVDGVEVFNKYARFTSGRLSFYDKNDIEVAYISDYKLYITHAEVTGTIKLGGYLIETSNGLAFKWVGRG